MTKYYLYIKFWLYHIETCSGTISILKTFTGAFLKTFMMASMTYELSLYVYLFQFLTYS